MTEYDIKHATEIADAIKIIESKDQKQFNIFKNLPLAISKVGRYPDNEDFMELYHNPLQFLFNILAYIRYNKNSNWSIKEMEKKFDTYETKFKNGYLNGKLTPIQRSVIEVVISAMNYSRTMLAVENAMIGASPIVGYGEEVQKSAVPSLYNNIEERGKILTDVDDPNDYLTLSLLELLKRSPWHIIDCSRYTYTLTDNSNPISKLRYLSLIVNTNEYIYDYYSTIFRYDSLENFMIYKKFTTTTNDMHTIGRGVSATEMYMDEHILPSIDELAKMLVPTIEEHGYEIPQEDLYRMENQNERAINNILKDIPVVPQSHEEYDIEHLRSYIYQVRHADFNRYANDYFMSYIDDENITEISYIDNVMMLLDIKNKFMCVPFIDLADDRKVKAFVMTKDNNIEIIEDFENLL